MKPIGLGLLFIEISSKGSIKSELFDIKGIGEVTADKLLKQYKSVKRIKNLSEEELISFLGPHKTKILLNHFNQTTT